MRYQHEVRHTAHRPMAAAALAGAITTSRKGKNAPLREQRSGRIDRRRLAKVATGDLRVFIRRGAPAPNAVRVTILVDASSSMYGPLNYAQRELGSRVDVAAQVVRDLADATEKLPWVTADVVAFTSSSEVDMYPLWKTGEDPRRIDSYYTINMGGTEEGYAIAFAMDEMLERIKANEQGLIVIVSDGGPAEPLHVKAVVKMCADHRIPVVSVALTDSAAQPLMYGLDNVVKFHANPRVIAKDMAKVIGRVI